MEELSEYEKARQRNLEANLAQMSEIFGSLAPARELIKDLVPVRALSSRPTRPHSAFSRDQPEEKRLYSMREVDFELRKNPTVKFKAECVFILRRSRRAPRVNYDEQSRDSDIRRSSRLTTRVLPTLKRLYDPDDDEYYGRPLKNHLTKQPHRRRGPIDSGRGKRKVGGRLYDSRDGRCCHQCRQKTTDIKVMCKRPGCGEMFDIDCLEVRYNDRKEDAQRHDWRCPVCQGTCNCSFCRPKKGLPSTGPLAHKAQKGGYYSVSHYLGDVIVLDDGTWKVAPQAAKFRYREAGDVSENEEDPERIDELAEDDSEKAVDSGTNKRKIVDLEEDTEEKDDERDEEDPERIDELAEDDSEKAVDSDTNKRKIADLEEDTEEKDDELEEDEEEIDELEEDSVLETEVADHETMSNKTVIKEDTNVKNVLLARKSDSNAVISTITSEKSDAVESKTEGKAKVEEKGKVSN
ncbi:hypothetical protein CPC16_001184 [Podila verticillata]|nr:hypothetical protein CPC16_001184 [Podila verticillata]